MTGDEGRDLEWMFPGGGEMAARMRGCDWVAAGMEEPLAWPGSLRTAARICLTSRFPMILWWGERLRFLYNDAYLPLLGSKHPALAKPGQRVWPEIWHIIGPMLESVMASGEATWSEDLLLPMERHGYWEETYWTYSYSPLHDDDGAVRGVFTAVADTTDRVIGERRLAVLQDLGAQAGRARDVVEACQLVAAVLARCGPDVPFAEIHLRQRGGEELSWVAGTLDRGAEARADGWPLAEVLAAGEPAVVRDLAERFDELPSGGWRTPPVEAMVLPLPGETGAEPVGVIVLAASAGRALDESYRSFLQLVARQTAALVNGAIAYQVQQRRAEELAELDRAKTAFFSNISHEFRTPLTLIMGPLAELREQHLTDAASAVRNELEVMHRNGLRLSKLVNTLLDFSRIEAGRMQARYERVDLPGFTAELASVFRSAVEKAGLTFDVDCPPLPEPVYLDRGMWEKVVLNLLSNALKFTFEGSIRVTVRGADAHAVVTVADTGIGVPEREIPRLFERFHRIENARARSNEGSGIGLALVRELVTLHGGAITADSVEGSGTTFTITVTFGRAHLPEDAVVVSGDGMTAGAPAAADPFVQEALRWLPDDVPGAASGVPGSTGPAVNRGSGPGRVLIADDNADMREYLERLLAPYYQVTAVADGRSALESARAHPPDLVVSDVMMPLLDGLALVGALRAEPRTAGVPVMLLSARAGQEAAVEGLAAGADDYLVKPFAAVELLARVRSTMELARLRNRHAAWRNALIDSLEDGFFVCDADGAVVEINKGFTKLLGYGPEDLPYTPPFPWWPEEHSDPDGHGTAMAAVTGIRQSGTGRVTAPVVHRDGRRLWMTASFTRLSDPETGQHVVVGTFRDVTAEHYTVQRQTALAALNQQLVQADTLPDAVRAAAAELRRIWSAHRVLAATFTLGGHPDAEPDLVCAGDQVAWADLAPEVRRAVTSLRDRPPLTPEVRHAGCAAMAVGHPQGVLVLWIDLGEPRPVTTEDQTLLAMLGGRLGQGLQRVHQIDQQRETVLALQRAILGPAQLPPGFAVRYQPATVPLKVGGDWYDTIELPDGRIAVVVGDCVGHSLAAATVMGQLRSAFRALLLQNPDPAGALTALDRFAAVLPGARCATVFCAVLNRETGELVYSSAGHPPAVLVGADGGTQLLEGGRSLMLGLRPERPRHDARIQVPARATLLLYTDGLVERRRRPLDDGITAAATAIHDGRGAVLDQLASRVMTTLAPAAGYEDDVALLLYRHPAPLEVEFAARPTEVTAIRNSLRTWLNRCRIDAQQTVDVLIAAGEACANAIEHGHRANPGGRIRLRATALVDRLHLTVTDTGSWKLPQPAANPHRGRGIALMRALMNEVTVDHGDTGTTVHLHARIA
ncbi:SpoIIE family protein phosphatase [Actinophytocola sp.]|uniref:SpoIIE family protein phosphatase n=1 Tax=Actinophytocola sp. TaxID=1872138 RepID=UPI00389AAF7B